VRRKWTPSAWRGSALVFDPVSDIALSEPLINIRCTLKNALCDDVIDAPAHDALLTAAQSVFYPQRTYARIISAAEPSVDARTRERFAAWVTDHACDQKRADAITALEYVRDIAGISQG
jgi:hypothetical protein